MDMNLEGAANVTIILTGIGAMFAFCLRYLGRKFDKIDERFDKIDERFERVDKEFYSLRAETSANFMRAEEKTNDRFDSVVGAFHSRLDDIDEDLYDIKKNVTDLNVRVSIVETRMEERGHHKIAHVPVISKRRGRIPNSQKVKNENI